MTKIHRVAQLKRDIEDLYLLREFFFHFEMIMDLQNPDIVSTYHVEFISRSKTNRYPNSKFVKYIIHAFESEFDSDVTILESDPPEGYVLISIKAD